MKFREEWKQKVKETNISYGSNKREIGDRTMNSSGAFGQAEDVARLKLQILQSEIIISPSCGKITSLARKG